MIIFLFPTRATGTCTCKVSAVGVKLITFQCFDKFQDAILGVSVQVKPLLKHYVWRDRWMSTVFVTFFELLISCWETATSLLKYKFLIFCVMAILVFLFAQYGNSTENLRGFNKHYILIRYLLETWTLFITVQCQTCIYT
jgi:hypothetical protein